MATSQRQKIDRHTANDIERCALEGVPFVIYQRPGMAPVFRKGKCVSGDAALANGFFIGKFGRPFSENLWISFDETGRRQECRRSITEALPKDTDKETYMSDLQALISSLENRPAAKTVISTVETRCLATLRLSQMVDNLLGSSADCFAYCCYHPEAGLWMGATPEVLLKADAKGNFSTMALAGTLPQGEAWDDKNLIEHEYVSQYIADRLASLGIEYRRHETKTIDYGPIKHLRTDFTGRLGEVSAFDVIDALNPTPALCGWPVDDALADIVAIERHKRECYGGCIGIVEDGNVEAYVNIRCAKARGSFITAFAGGGIISLSSPKVEWEEARIKRLSIFNKLING